MLGWIMKIIRRGAVSAPAAGRHQRRTSHNAVSVAFTKVREENGQRDTRISKLTDRVNYHSVCLKAQAKTIGRLEKQLQHIAQSISRTSPTLPVPSPTMAAASTTPQPASPTVSAEGKYVGLESLTQLQQATLIILAKLMAREGSKWIGMKTLVQQIYPQSEYNKVRTTIFEYVRVLEELGLVTRLKQSNLTFVSVTAKGMEIVHKSTAKKKEKLIRLVEERT
jgi:hypothetical protein